MKLYVSFVHWMLIFISITSSLTAFLLVASQNIQTSNIQHADEKASGVIDNATMKNEIDESFHVSSTDDMPEFKTRTNAETDVNDNVIKEDNLNTGQQMRQEKEFNKDATIHAVLEDSISLGHNPNFSEGISGTGQAVVLTLVDSAVAELQSLAESKRSPPSGLQNESLVTTSTLSPSTTTTTPLSTILPQVEDQVAAHLNVKSSTEGAVEHEESTGSLVEEDRRQEGQKLMMDEEVFSREDEEEDLTRTDDVMTTAPELNDSAARAQLIADESSGVIVDSLVTAGPTDPHEDIPSFSEWSQKRLEEAEKKKSHPNVSVQNPGGPGRGVGSMKIRLKNYASPDCGAKVVAANPESRSARSVLAAVKDEYMLNTCTSRIWFVVELCEAIQAKKIELANFELFSSSPKDFTVYVSDRFPTRDWSSVGQFVARDEKDIQSFNLQPQLFGKFIKVELQSHYGSEHFCPISLFRVYGTSEFEVLETETENHVQQMSDHGTHEDAEDDDEDANNDEELLDGGGSRNLLGSATDAVINIVKKATEALVKSGNSNNSATEKRANLSSSVFAQSCGTPRYSVICKHCANQTLIQLVRLITCFDKSLERLIDLPLVEDILTNSRVCYHSDNATTNRLNFVSSFFPNHYVIGLCNMLAIRNRKVSLYPNYNATKHNVSSVHKESPSPSTQKEQVDATSSVSQSATTRHSDVTVSSKATQQPKPESPTLQVKPTSVPLNILAAETPTSQIKPTKTIVKEEEQRRETVRLPESENEQPEVQKELLIQPAKIVSTLPVTSAVTKGSPYSVKSDEPATVAATLLETTSTATITVNNLEVPEDGQRLAPEAVKPKAELKPEIDQSKLLLMEQDLKISAQEQSTFDSILSDLRELEGDAMGIVNGHKESVSQPSTNTNTPQQKESVFLRLSNRIKALERNMSLSSQYLEELSRRYKKQVEEMQRSLERAVTLMSEESRKADERDAKRLEEIAILRQEVSSLSKSIESLAMDRASWRFMFSTFGQHAVFIVFDVFIILLIFYYCRRGDDLDDDDLVEETRAPSQTALVVRHQAPQLIGKRASSKKQKKRRPSEVASSISGTYQDLMIEDKAKDKIKKKKRKHEDSKSDIVEYKSTIPGGSAMPSRRVSSNDAPQLREQQSEQPRPESAPSAALRVQVLSEKMLARESDSKLDASSNDTDVSKSRGSILKSTMFSSPAFMRTALRSGSKRMSFKLDPSEDKSDLETSMTAAENGSANGHVEESDESNATQSSTKKEKKSLKQMVRKFF